MPVIVRSTVTADEWRDGFVVLDGSDLSRVTYAKAHQPNWPYAWGRWGKDLKPAPNIPTPVQPAQNSQPPQPDPDLGYDPDAEFPF